MAREAQAATPVDSGLSLEQIRFRYAITGREAFVEVAACVRRRAVGLFQFPGGIAPGELPPCS